MTAKTIVEGFAEDDRLDAAERAEAARKKAEFAAILAEIDAEPAPCDGCPYRNRCKNELLACLRFAIYVHPEFLSTPRLKYMAKRAPHDAPYPWIFRAIYNFEEMSK